MRHYFEKHYANKLVNLDKINKFLDKYNSNTTYQELNYKETRNLNREIMKIESVAKNLPLNKISGSNGC
jgi:oligoribonuclease NrnB/cAMP/cGMP phosphodiesterase (DHH superfamily)